MSLHAFVDFTLAGSEPANIRVLTPSGGAVGTLVMADSLKREFGRENNQLNCQCYCYAMVLDFPRLLHRMTLAVWILIKDGCELLLLTYLLTHSCVWAMMT